MFYYWHSHVTQENMLNKTIFLLFWRCPFTGEHHDDLQEWNGGSWWQGWRCVDPALQSGQLQRKQILFCLSWALNTVHTVYVAAVAYTKIQPSHYRLNMELELQILFGPHVHSCTYWLSPRNTHPPFLHLGSYSTYEGRYWSARLDDISLWPTVSHLIPYRKLLKGFSGQLWKTYFTVVFLVLN